MEYQIRSFEANDFDKLANFATEVFVSKEPMAKTLGVKKSDLFPMIECLLVAALNTGLGTVAVGRDGKVFSFALSLECSTDPTLMLKVKLSNQVNSIFKFLDMLENRFFDLRSVSRSEVGVMLMVGTAFYRDILVENKSDWSKITPSVLQYELDQLMQKGIKEVFVQSTGIKSQKYLEQFGFQSLYQQKYEDYYCPILKTKPFLNLAPEKCILGFKECMR